MKGSAVARIGFVNGAGLADLRLAKLGSRQVRGRKAPVTKMAASQASAPQTTARDVLLPAGMVGLSVTNRVFYRVLLVPMKDYTFFISQLVTFAYVLVYGAFLARRRQLGIVTPEMIQFAKDKWNVFAVIGALEALTFAIQLYTGARLPGSLLGVLSQGILPFTMILSAVFRGRKYSLLQVFGVIVMICGVLTTIYPTFSSLPSSVGAELLINAGLFFTSAAFIAIALVLKEGTLQGANLDVFVVNTASSFWQMIGIIVLMPFSFAVALGSLSAETSKAYIVSGLKALAGMQGLKITPFLGLGYIVVNLTMNILGITLIKKFSAVTTILTSFVTVPMIALVFCLNLPLLSATPFTPLLVVGICIVLLGLGMYNYSSVQSALKQEPSDKTA